MKKKGFTITELLAVIIILGLLATITIPTIENIITRYRDKTYERQINNIKEGAKNWANSNLYNLSDENGFVQQIELGFLKREGFLDKDLINPATGELFPDSLIITITNVNGNYVYRVLDGTDNDSVPNIPSIVLKGDTLVYVDLGMPYKEPGYEAKSSSGNVLDDVRIFIKKDDEKVDNVKTDELGKYLITYYVKDGDTSISVIRTVIVRDSTRPELFVPGTVTIPVTQTSFDYMLGVSAIDNSNEYVAITFEGEVKLGVAGRYVITYKATDKSGNTTIKSTVIVE